MKSFVKIFLVLCLIFIAYLSFMIIGGGFRKKPLNIMAMNNENSPFLFAHRGIAADYPENSREAIEAARSRGFRGLEIDIRKSSDNEFILFHDEDCKRLLGIDSKINKLSIAQIREYPLIFSNKESLSHVITLKEMLDGYKDDFIIYFDLKLKSFDDVEDLVKIIQSYGIARSAIIASTSAPVIFFIEYNYPGINTSLEGFNSGKEWLYYLMPKNLKPDFFSSFAGKVDAKHIAWLKKKDLISSRIVYDVDTSNYHTVMQWGLKNLIIDYDSNMGDLILAPPAY